MMGKDEIKFYDREEVWAPYKNNQTEISRVEKTINLIPKDVNSVLDIGCGNGILTNMIEKSFVVGIDFARTPLKNVIKNSVPLQKIWLFYKTSEKHHKSDIYMP
jgi:2-polyprenyl-3-methyl-5-hydroxy-6-metoxy-1,4-benzoquinol methylase